MGANELHRFRQQVLGLIDTCKAVLAGKSKEDTKQIDETTQKIAQAVLQEAKLYVSEDKILQAVSLAPPISWTSLLAAMEIIVRTLPISQGRLNVQTGGRYTG
jgi:hypothetical protein